MRGKRPETFLPRQPDHSETGILAKLTPEELARRGFDPYNPPRRKKRLVRRTLVAFLIRWRWFVTAALALVMTINLIAFGLVETRDWGLNPNTPPTQAAPTLNELNASIALGQHFIESLYKPLPNGEAVQSEASGVPLRAHFLNQDSWVLLGEDNGPSTTLSNVHDSATTDDYVVTFSAPDQGNALSVHVQIDWAFSKTQYQLTLTPTSVKEPAELWLDTTKMGAYAPGPNPATVRALSNSNQSQLRMLRFTTRHATQEAFLYWSTYGHDPARAAALGKFLDDNGFTAGFDLRAPLYPYGKNGDLPDDMPADAVAYPDCDHIATGGPPLAYAYRSKVCLYESEYIDSGERDPFLQAWDALTILVKYKDPNHSLPESSWWIQGGSPTAIAVHLQGQWNRTGWGVPKCTPFACAELSGIRTSVFGALETQLGYVYHNAASQKFADAAAKVITMTQVGTDGKIRADNGTTYIRPGQVGEFLGAWNGPNLEFTQPSTPALPVAIALILRGARPTPLEYQGLVASNSETTLDALGFLQMYRCQKYKVGC